MNERANVTVRAADAKREKALPPKRQVGPLYSSPSEYVLNLQRTVGNQVVQRLFKSGAIRPKLKIGQPNDLYEQEADRVAEQVMRMPVAVAERGISAHGERGALTVAVVPSLVAGASLASLFPSLPAPCSPATSLRMAAALHAFVSGSYLPFSRGMFGPQTTSLWADYLNVSLGLPRPARSFSGGGEIVDGFRTHHKSAEAEREVVDASIAALGGPAASLMPLPGTTSTVAVVSLVPAATLRARINNPSDPMGLNFDRPASTIPGNIAGGIGSGGPPGSTVVDPDTRAVNGFMRITLDSSGSMMSVTPLLTFHVHDTMDFCPGALGGMAARVETVPMSILEATEGRFGPVFAADVPFDVFYPGPGVARTVKTVPRKPPPPVPIPITTSLRHIRFNLDQPRHAGSTPAASMDASGRANLKTLIDDLRRNPAWKVELVGRASPEGSAAYNMDLSSRRVRMIGKALVDAGIPAARINSTPAVSLPSGCTAVAPGLFSCGKIGATGSSDREVQAHIF